LSFTSPASSTRSLAPEVDQKLTKKQKKNQDQPQEIAKEGPWKSQIATVSENVMKKEQLTYQIK
jgi:hypothetical protein